MLRVCAILDSGSVGGVATYALSLAHGFARHAEVDVRYDVFCPTQPTDALRAQAERYGVALLECATPLSRSRILAHRARLPDCDVWHVADYRSNVTAALARRGTGTSIVGTQHGPPASSPALRMRAYRAMDRRYRRRLGANVAVDRGSSDYLRAIGVSPVAEIQNWPDPCQVRARSCDAERPLRIGYVGRFETEKGVDRLPEVAQAIRDAGVSVELILQGEGSRLDETYERCSHHVPTTLVPSGEPVWSVLDVALFPSRSEGRPFGPLEALSSGAMVICSSAGEMESYDAYGARVLKRWSADAVAAALAAGQPPPRRQSAVDWTHQYEEMLSMHASVFHSVST